MTVTAEERADILIESGAPAEDRIERDATGRIALTSARGGSARLDVRVPAGTDLVVGTLSGRAELRGPLGEVRVTTVSGSVEVERAETLDVRSVSGSIEVKDCSGRCRLATKSGRATCGSVGDALVSTLSGEVQVERVERSAKVQSASGRVELGAQGQGDIAVQTMSGAVRVAFPRGVRPRALLKSLTGRPRCECEEGDDCEVKVRSLSGKIEVVPS
ncbi:MAG: DUF4097 family beta strand repeat-containing protein [Dehalococcoidia bacterium]|nr:DUF4097 family beta strand repeat-containing protein [Dehalococcoidia bacterium]